LTATSDGTIVRLFGPAARGFAARAGRVLERRGDEHVLRMLLLAGLDDVTLEQYHVRQLAHATTSAAAGGLVAALTVRTPSVVLVATVAGVVHGAVRVRKHVERTIRERSARMRLELYTVNQLLAMHVRTGAGPMQAVQRVVDRGRGEVVRDLAAVVRWTRSGMGEADAFHHAAELTPEPGAARTYRLLAAGVERGVDLGPALLDLSTDLRDARRDELQRDAVRRRAAMLVPTIGVLAPIMLLFIAAPLPSIVLGHR
jgi:Flp pilus assembly protein TadB